jgi:multidrug resistance efflux pump
MKLYKKEELKYSRLFFDKTPPAYMTFLGFFLMSLIIAGILSLNFIPKNYIVRAQGTIEANDKAYITPLVNGHVIDINQPEGAVVKKGDKLLTLSVGTEGVQESEIDKQISELKQKQAIFDKYEKSLNEKKNHMASQDKEQEYYGKVEYYLSQVKDEASQNQTKSENLAEKEAELAVLQGELTKIQADDYAAYTTTYQRKQEALADLQAKRKKVTETSEAESLDEQIKTFQNELADSRREYEKTAETNIKAKNDEIKAKNQEIKELKNQSQSQSDSTKQQLISELGTARTQTAEKISELSSQKTLKQTDTNLFTLTANKDGIVHYLSPIKVGLGLQAFQPIAQMDKGKDSKLVGEVYISAQDRSKIKVGNTTKLSLAGVNQTKYGVLTGKVKSISDGTITQGSGEQTQVLYQVNVTLDKTTLTSGEEEILAKASMPTIASIVYEKENYMEWLLEQLNFMKEK